MNNDQNLLRKSSESFSLIKALNKVQCPRCNKFNCINNGNKIGAIKRQKYFCKNCNFNFTGETYVRMNQQKNAKITCRYCGSCHYHKRGKDKQGIQQYKCQSCGRYFKENYQRIHFANYLELGEDVWDATSLGLTPSLHRKQGGKIIFKHIKQLWLKVIVKAFVKFQAATGRAYGTILGYCQELNTFSKFLSERKPDITDIHQLERSVIVDYLEYLSKFPRVTEFITRKLGVLRTLFLVGTINNWFEVPPHLVRDEDFPKFSRRLPRYIPSEVLQQLNEHLDALPEPVMRMVIVIQECGLRVGELLTLSINCLEQDSKGQWSIRLRRGKTKTESIIPISQELAAVVCEQQQYIIKYLDKNFNYLFSARNRGFVGRKYKGQFHPVNQVMTTASFIKFLKELAEQFDICDTTGNRWNFQSHQFRHTVATRMINLGVPLISIQRYLGHASPTMTQVYAHLHDETLRRDLSVFQSKVLNIAGEVVEPKHPELDDNLDLHLMRKNILSQSLPNGSCARPVVKGACPHANACLTCGDFRTTIEFLEQHKEHLAQTQKIIDKAKTHDWQRQVEMNEQVKNNLEQIINSLQVQSPDELIQK